MKRIILLIVLTLMCTYACKQPAKNDNNTTTNSENMVEAQTGDQTKSAKPEKSGKVVARVNGEPIYEDDIRSQDIESAITEEILYQEGLKRGLDKELEDKVLAYKKSIIVRNMKSDILQNMEPYKEISDEDIKQYYEDNKMKYTNVKIQEINFSDKGMADEIEKMAGEGGDLRDIADNYQDSDVKFKDIGYNRQLTTYFDKIEVGSVTGVIEKKDGTYSILKIVDVRETPLNQVKNPVKENLEALRKRRAYNDYVKKIAEENNFKVEIIGEAN